jgi:hypothetical protein
VPSLKGVMSQLKTLVVEENKQSQKRKRSLDGSMSLIQRQINNLRADLAKLEHEQEMQKICKAASQGVPTQGNGSDQSSMPLYRKKGSQVSLSNCAEIFCFLEEYGVLVCKQHRTAVINLDKHLSQHHSVPASSRRQIVDCFSRLVYDAPVRQPLNHLNKAIAHPAPKLRACNANQVLILSCYSLAWRYPLNLPAFSLAWVLRNITTSKAILPYKQPLLHSVNNCI